MSATQLSSVDVPDGWMGRVKTGGLKNHRKQRSAGKEPEVLAKKNQAIYGCLVAIAAITLLPGCNAFGLRKQLQQLETENGRLLSEFRAERQRRETAERTAQQLEIRLAESEKLLARQTQDSSPGRLSSLSSFPPRPDFPGNAIDPAGGRAPSNPWDKPLDPAGTGGDYRWQRRSN